MWSFATWVPGELQCDIRHYASDLLLFYYNTGSIYTSLPHYNENLFISKHTSFKQVSIQIKFKPFFTSETNKIFYKSTLWGHLKYIYLQILCHSSLMDDKALSIVLQTWKDIWDWDVQCLVELVMNKHQSDSCRPNAQKKITKPVIAS